MSAFEVGQTVYWVNSQGQERSGTVVGLEDGDVRVDVSDADAKMTLLFEVNEVCATPLAAWRARKAAMRDRVDASRRQLHAALGAYSQATRRIIELLDAEPVGGDGSFQGGTDGDWEAR